MRRTIFMLIIAIAASALSACGQGGSKTYKQIESAVNSDSSGKQGSSSSAEIEAEGDGYRLLLPKGFTEQKSFDERVKEWHSDDFEETEFEVAAYDVGVSTYELDTVPKTFQEYSEDTVVPKDGTTETEEEIYFDYNNGDDYEEFSVIRKNIYGEGSDRYELEKINKTMKDIDNGNSDESLPDDVVAYDAKKLIVNQNNRSEAIIIVIHSNENGDTDKMRQILDSFQWK